MLPSPRASLVVALGGSCRPSAGRGEPAREVRIAWLWLWRLKPFLGHTDDVTGRGSAGVVCHVPIRVAGRVECEDEDEDEDAGVRGYRYRYFYSRASSRTVGAQTQRSSLCTLVVSNGWRRGRGIKDCDSIELLLFFCLATCGALDGEMRCLTL